MLCDPTGGSDEEAYVNEKPQHHVRITQPFYLGVTPVTQGQYRAITGANPSHFKGSDDLLVEQVSWEEARAFCETLSALEKEQLGGARYRLPTEAEWEYACRTGTTTRFSRVARVRSEWFLGVLHASAPESGLAAAGAGDRIQFNALRVPFGRSPMLDISRDIHSLTDFKKKTSEFISHGTDRG
jgi:hypothetical protein